jgi:hypothetical protein
MFGLCEQEEQAKLLRNLHGMTAIAREEKLDLELQLARCLKETDILHQQLMKERADHQVGQSGFCPFQNRI